MAQVRARAAGILQQRMFKEGSDVKAGQTLFRIDEAPTRRLLDSAKANQPRQKPTWHKRKRSWNSTVRWSKPMRSASKISSTQRLPVKQSQADVASTRQRVRTAGINLGYATVTAPISGRIGRALVTEGALVGQGEATPLAVIQQIDPVYVNFHQSANDTRRGSLRKASDANSSARRARRSGRAPIFGTGTD